ncbi:hypothetical protein ACJJIE_03680 [Microbulbifer sp. TRSA001]|uniref:hypothetical protein n=1 Tax=Microbulbifer sp. TRSA001 TaxID=3243381 RepID=UPI0040396E0A
MAHPIYKDLLEQWRGKAKEIAGTSEGFTFYDPEFNEFLHWMFSQFQAVVDSQQPSPATGDSREPLLVLIRQLDCVLHWVDPAHSLTACTIIREAQAQLSELLNTEVVA